MFPRSRGLEWFNQYSECISQGRIDVRFLSSIYYHRLKKRIILIFSYMRVISATQMVFNLGGIIGKHVLLLISYVYLSFQGETWYNLSHLKHLGWSLLEIMNYSICIWLINIDLQCHVIPFLLQSHIIKSSTYTIHFNPFILFFFKILNESILTSDRCYQ